MFLVRPQAAANAGDDFWFQPIGGTSASGASVSPTSAMKLSVVYACIRVLSEAVAKIPVRVYSSEFDEAADLPLAKLLRRKPNPWQTSFEWREMMQAHLSLRGNAISQVVYAGSQVVALVPCHPDRTTVEQIAEGRWRYRVRDWQGQERVLLQDEVLHLRQTALDGFNGLSTVGTQRESIGTALSQQDYSGRFFKNGARHGGSWIEFPGKFENSEARARFRDAYRASLAGENAFSTPVLDRGMKLHELGMTNADAQMIENRKLSDSDLCRMFLVPPHMVGILDRATNNNIEHQGREFYSVTLMGLLRRWEESLEAALLTEDEQDSGLRIEFDIDEITRADSKTRWDIYHNAVLDGILTPNEVRERERYKPLEGLDEVIQPMNAQTPTQRSSTDTAPPAPAPAPEPAPSRPTREAALLSAAADRCVTREVNGLSKVARDVTGHLARLEAAADFYDGHAGWMARAMLIDPAAAARACEARFDELREDQFEAVLDRWKDGGGLLLLSSMAPEDLREQSIETKQHAERMALIRLLAGRETPAPVVNVTVPERAVTVAAPVVTVEAAPAAPIPAPSVTVNVPEQPAPVVNVSMPQQPAPTVHVAVPEAPAPAVTVNARVVAEDMAPDGMPWAKQTTVDQRDKAGRPSVYTTRPIRR